MVTNLKPENHVPYLLEILRGQRTIQSVAVEIGHSVVEVQEWLDTFLHAGEAAITNPEAQPSLWRHVRAATPVLLVTFALLSIAFFIGAAIYDYRASPNWQEAGQRADFWGGHIASAGSFAGTFLLFLAILLQYEELKSQREELKHTRAEMRLARSVSETQLQLARENATVTNVIELVRLSLETEVRLSQAQIAQGKKNKEEEEFIAKDQHARVEKVLTVLFNKEWLPADVKRALQVLYTGEEA